MTAIDNSTDPELQLKKRARRRLVGAAALALLAVIVLPMLMDQEPRPPVQDIQIQIPSQDAVTSKALVADEAPATKPAPSAAASKAPVTAENPATEKTAADAIRQSAQELTRQDANKDGASKAAEPGKPAQAATTATKKDTAGLDKLATELTPKAVQAADAGSAWIVQLGAYKEAGNVKHLLAKMKELGLPAYTEKLNSEKGERTRVRVGPFATREAAEKAQEKIKKIGVASTVAAK